MLELIGTIGIMAKPKAVKFYVAPELMDQCEAIFKDQGTNLSEGIVRLLRCLAESDKEMRPVLLLQTPGDAAKAIAEHILKRKPPLKIAAKKLK